MRYFLTWQDFMRQPTNKTLLEEKGMAACKQRFLQEQNKMSWYDPAMIAENAYAGISVPSAAGGAAGGSSDFITGNTAETRIINWTNGNFTASNAPAFEAVNYFDLEGIKAGVTDFSFGHANTFYRFRVFLTTGSLATVSLPAGYHGVLTASLQSHVVKEASSSVFNGLKDSINKAAAGAVVGGVTNTSEVAPSSLFTATLNAASTSLSIAFDQPGKVADYGVYYPGTVSGSIASTGTSGDDTFFNDQGAQTFNGQTAPYTSMPRKS